MKKVFVLPAEENWICDRMAREWHEFNPDMSEPDPEEADILWLLSDWRWQHVPKRLLFSKPIVVTVHHIVPSKFDWNASLEFAARDKITTKYHVFNQRTFDQVKSLTKKEISLIPYWANQHIWRRTSDTQELRKKYGLETSQFVISSFQRDTEGRDLVSPKLEKGPDIFVDTVLKLRSHKPNLIVLLAGWRRQYVINRLQQESVPFVYIERPKQDVVNELYQCTDLYVVSSRHEGGPQALIECGLIRVNVVSTPVGIAEQVLPMSAINEDPSLAEPAIPDVSSMLVPGAFMQYRNFFNDF